MRQIDARWPGNPVSESGILQIPVWQQGLPANISDCWPEVNLSTLRATGNSFRLNRLSRGKLPATCASERGAPECSKQGSPGATPHVGQGTADNCSAVRSGLLIWRRYDKTSRETVPF
jgi:hypothetical protein